MDQPNEQPLNTENSIGHEHMFILSEQSSTGKILITPNLFLEKNNIYQIYCQITSTVNIGGKTSASHMIISTAHINGGLMGGPGGYRVDCIASDLGSEAVSDTNIKVNINKNKLNVIIDCGLQCELAAFATFKITEFVK